MTNEQDLPDREERSGFHVDRSERDSSTVDYHVRLDRDLPRDVFVARATYPYRTMAENATNEHGSWMAGVLDTLSNLARRDAEFMYDGPENEYYTLAWNLNPKLVHLYGSYRTAGALFDTRKEGLFPHGSEHIVHAALKSSLTYAGDSEITLFSQRFSDRPVTTKLRWPGIPPIVPQGFEGVKVKSEDILTMLGATQSPHVLAGESPREVGASYEDFTTNLGLSVARRIDRFEGGGIMRLSARVANIHTK